MSYPCDVARDFADALDPISVLARNAITPDPWQERVLRSTADRLVLVAGRQQGKSTAAVALALHAALYRPGTLTLILSPSLRQSSEVLRKLRALLPPYPPERWPVDVDAVLMIGWANGSRIVSLPGDGRTVRTYSPHLVILDEAAYVREDLPAAVLPMLMVTRGRLVALSSAGPKRGWLYRVWSEGGDEWERHRATAEENPRLDHGRLETERRLHGETIFRREYAAEFTDDEEDHGNPRLLSPETIAALRAQLPDDDEPGARPS